MANTGPNKKTGRYLRQNTKKYVSFDFLLKGLLLELPWGQLGDRFGRRREALLGPKGSPFRRKIKKNMKNEKPSKTVREKRF